jgi:hypothetical protein
MLASNADVGTTCFLSCLKRTQDQLLDYEIVFVVGRKI